jgi:nicotinamidase-related amidase
VDGVRAALLVIDMQKAFATDDATRRSYVEASMYINAAAGLFRDKKHMLVSICHHDPGGPHPGDPGYEFTEDLVLGTPDVVIHKTHENAFYETGLADLLRAEGVEVLVVTGFCAEYCVLSTYRGAEERGFTPLFLKGGLAARSAASIDFVEKLGSVVSISALAALLPEASPGKQAGAQAERGEG